MRLAAPCDSKFALLDQLEGTLKVNLMDPRSYSEPQLLVEAFEWNHPVTSFWLYELKNGFILTLLSVEDKMLATMLFQGGDLVKTTPNLYKGANEVRVMKQGDDFADLFMIDEFGVFWKL